jgi:nitroreductase
MQMHARRSWPLLAALAILALVVAPAPPAALDAPALGPGPLSPPPRSGGATLIDALWKRRSTRAFSDKPLSRDELSFLLWAGGGMNRPEEKRRTAPAAWDAYAVSIYVTSAAGTVLYDPLAHALKPAGADPARDLRKEIPRAAGTQAAPAQLILVADFSRYPARASPDSRRYLAHADSGVIAENVSLAAAALGLGTVVTADARPESKTLLGLGAEQMALYVLPVGHPAEPAPGAEGKKQ